MMTKEALYIGIMSGTSLDGVDTALVSIKDREINLLASDFLSYPESLKTQVLAICHGQETNLKHIGELDHQLGLLYAEAVNSLLSKTTYTEHDIAAIGNHGQTVFHQPDGAIRFTTQLGDNNLLATLTGIDTIGDFRRKDMALGGQGAPLVPAFHRYLFADSDSTQVIVNIGGISNVSILQPNGDVMQATDCNKQQAEVTLKETQYDVKLSILMILTGLDKQQAHQQLHQQDGFLRKAVISKSQESE